MSVYEIVTQKEWNSELCNSPVLSKVKCNGYEMTNKRANVANTWIKQTSNHQGKLGGDPGMLPHAPRRPRRCQLNDSGLKNQLWVYHRCGTQLNGYNLFRANSNKISWTQHCIVSHEERRSWSSSSRKSGTVNVMFKVLTQTP